MAKLNVSMNNNALMTVTRFGIDTDYAVYVMLASKPLKYKHGDSPIAYIGTTKKGIDRVFQSAAYRAQDILSIYGVMSFQVQLVTCKPRKGVKTWHKMERAMLLEFRREFGEVPYCNIHGTKIKETDEFNYFTRDRIRNVVLALSNN